MKLTMHNTTRSRNYNEKQKPTNNELTISATRIQSIQLPSWEFQTCIKKYIQIFEYVCGDKYLNFMEFLFKWTANCNVKWHICYNTMCDDQDIQTHNTHSNETTPSKIATIKF